MLKNSVTINSRKLDGSVNRSWKCGLVEQNGSLLVFLGVFDREVEHPDLGIIRRGTVSYEYYWLDQWYNVFRFENPDGQLRNYYCNVNMPPVFENSVLDYVDLDIDVVVWPGAGYKILDLEEFESNAVKFGYSAELRSAAQKALSDVVQLIETKAFPFTDLETT